MQYNKKKKKIKNNNDTHFKTLKDSINSLKVTLSKLKKKNTVLRTECIKLCGHVEKLDKSPKADDISFDLSGKARVRISKARNVLVSKVLEQ